MQALEGRIYSGIVITPYRTIENGEIRFDNGKITYVGPSTGSPAPGLNLDAHGNYISPGFLDIHTHGAGGYDFMDATVEAFHGAARAHVRHGTTSLLATTLAAGKEEILRTLCTFRKAKESEPMLLGLHLEGPYFSMEQRGAQDPAYIRSPDPGEYEEILQASQDILRWSAAPELPGSMVFAAALRQRGILPSIGHSDAVYTQVVEALENGFTHITHLYSGMSGLVRRRSTRYPGVIESAYMLDEMTVEIIADGCHLPPEILRLVYRQKGPDKVALITDSMRAAGMPEGKSILGSKAAGQEVLVEDGVAWMPDHNSFAGSVATADRLVRNMIHLAGAPLADAVRMMTVTPARILGLANKGILRPGNDADIIIFNPDIQIQAAVVQGCAAYQLDAE